jgi:hypothetical protein
MEERMTSRTIFVATALLAWPLAVIGCQNSPSDSGGPGAQASVQTKPTPVGSQNTTKVTDGSAPLQFTFVAGGNVRVVDATTGKQVAKTRAAPNTTIHVDAANGVFANDKRITLGPLPADHRYEIWMDR